MLLEPWVSAGRERALLEYGANLKLQLSSYAPFLSIFPAGRTLVQAAQPKNKGPAKDYCDFHA